MDARPLDRMVCLWISSIWIGANEKESISLSSSVMDIAADVIVLQGTLDKIDFVGYKVSFVMSIVESFICKINMN